MGDSYRNYNYNPIAYSFFSFTETALTADGKPTARFHEYTLVHNPSQSTTKGAEMTVQLSLAKKIALRSVPSGLKSNLRSSALVSDVRMSECLRKLDTKIGYAANAYISAKLIGGPEKTYSYSLTAAGGKNEMTHKWNIKFESEQEHSYLKNLCVNGLMQYPTSWTSDAKFLYSNKVAFGETCDQYWFNIKGNTYVSHKQQEHSFNSEESKKCMKHTQEEERYRHELNNCREHEIERKSKLEKKHSISALKKMEYCEKKIDQSSALDQTDITISYSQTLPTEVYTYCKILNTVYFKNVRIPTEMKEIVPLVARKNSVEQTYKALTGTSLLAKCVLGQGYVHSFDKRSYSYQIDECDHMIASDCSKDFNHAIL